MRVPFVGIQAPWALTCAASACAEVRGYLRESLRKLGPAGLGGAFASGGGAFGGGAFGAGAAASGGFSGAFGDSGFGNGSGALLTDGNLGADGTFGAGDGNLSPTDGGHLGGSGPPPSADPERWREAIYAAAYTSLSNYGPCAEQRREPRAVLDAVFNACLADDAPNGRRDPSGKAFPPMPPAVDEAERNSASGGPAIPAPPQPLAPSAGQEQHNAKVGEV